jgi:[ribosomal protein S18]-alanine N-acetyltransferase
VILRPVTEADGAALAEVHASAFPEPWTANELVRFSLDRSGIALVAELEDAVAGFILCRAIAGEAEVLTLAVRPQARRRGLARALLDAALGIATPTCEAAFLEVAEDNPGAVALYQGCGFERVGRRGGYYSRRDGPAVAAIVMRRALNS